ncbi:Flp family type IVb pilin [Aeromicrobium alkaliterrae]
MKTIRKVHQAERGATSVEYALLIVVIAVIIAGTVLGMGEAIGALFDVVPF